MGTDATVSIALIIAAVGFFITIYNFNVSRKKDTLSEAARMEEIKTACLKANMKLDEVCTRLTGIQTDVKTLQQANSSLDHRVTVVEQTLQALKER
jgi:hypothetical protein